MKKKLGLIGYPLSHSFSEEYFREKFLREKITGFEYRNYPLRQIADIKGLVKEERELIGLNVTIPYKLQVIPFLGELEETARQIGAVNTIRITRHRGSVEMKGFNTDAYGFLNSLKPLLDQKHDAALVLGTGGASRAVHHALGQLGIECRFVSRNPSKEQLHYRELCLPVIRRHKLIINTTPLGTYPDTESFPDIPYDLISGDHILYDLVYNPPETEFLRLGRKKGAVTVNGLKMLELQAEASWRIWTSDRIL